MGGHTLVLACTVTQTTFQVVWIRGSSLPAHLGPAIWVWPHCMDEFTWQHFGCPLPLLSLMYTVISLSPSSLPRRKPPKLDDDKADPSQSLMKLMQQMYDEGDDEMKRTIKKSWYESQQKRKAESDTMDM